MERIHELYTLIERYAAEKRLPLTAAALPLAEKQLGTALHRPFKTSCKQITGFEHSMSATKMLIDLHLLLSAEEEDRLLCAMLCHDIDFSACGDAACTGSAALSIVRTIKRPPFPTEEEKAPYYSGIRADKLCVLAALADRCDLVEQLSEISVADVRDFVGEMRAFMLPVCIYAMQYYPDCAMAVKIMMEKIRCLIDVSDIISNRYQKRELAYNSEILSLLEENARLRGMIAELSGEAAL